MKTYSIKHSFLFVLTFLITLPMFAQAPQGISNQAVIRNSNNELMNNAAIGIQVSILKGSIEGNAVYIETHTVQSNTNGLITYILGNGTPVSGDFAGIDWAEGPYFLKTDVDTQGGVSYSMSGTSQLLSVPFSLFSNKASALTLTAPDGSLYSINVDNTGNLTTVNVTPQWQCGDPFTDPRDGNIYNSVLIGEQCWMKENLAYLPAVSPASEGSDTSPFYYVYDYNDTVISQARATEYYENYGVLYNWSASLTACPPDWHLPSIDEWTVLADLFGGVTVAGGKLKSTRTAPDFSHPRWESPNQSATNESNFSALPGGARGINGGFFSLGFYAYFWSSTEDNSFPNLAKKRYLQNSYGGIPSDIGSTRGGSSVRCVKD